MSSSSASVSGALREAPLAAGVEDRVVRPEVRLEPEGVANFVERLERAPDGLLQRTRANYGVHRGHVDGAHGGVGGCAAPLFARRCRRRQRVVAAAAAVGRGGRGVMLLPTLRGSP